MADEKEQKDAQEEIYERLLKDTRFTESELRDFLAASDGPRLKRTNFDEMLEDAGIKQQVFKDRMWDVFDLDDDDQVEIEEVIRNLNVLQRGTTEDITKMFFELFDLNHDQSLGMDEVLGIYQALLKDCMDKEMEAEDAERIRAFLKEADTNKDGQVNYEEFDAAIKKFMKEGEVKTQLTCGAITKIALLIFLTAWFEMGVSFGLPAMGALSEEMKIRFSISDGDIGLLTGLYYITAVIGPLVGGVFVTKVGPAPVLLAANILVVIGTILQAIPGTYGLLAAGRLFLGLGGEITPFCTVEILNILFPGQFMLMCGVRNLIQSGSGFLAFVVLPALATGVSTDMALWFIVIMAGISTVTTFICFIYINKQKEKLPSGKRPSALFNALATRFVPTVPSRFADYKLPLAFYLATFGIKVFYLPPFAFTAFSVGFFKSKFGLPPSEASFLTGFMSLLAGLLGPIMGPLSDWTGNRALMLGGFIVPSLVAFLLFSFTSITPWLGIILLAFTYGFGDTCAYCSIRLIVGPKRAGIGYGVYGLIGNFLAFVVPVVGGAIMDMDTTGGVWMSFYFAMLMLLGVIIWLIVRLLLGKKHALELPAKDLVETEGHVIDAASLITVGQKRGEPEKKEKDGEEMAEVAGAQA